MSGPTVPTGCTRPLADTLTHSLPQTATPPALRPGTVILVDALTRKRALLFTRPRRSLACRHVRESQDFLARLEAERAAGAHLAGFLAYEFGFAFEPKLAASWQDTGEPLAWFGVYDAPQILTLEALDDLLGQAAGQPGEGAGGLANDRANDLAHATIDSFTYDMDRARYAQAFAAVQHHLAVGDIYQANLTMRARFRHQGPAAAQFARLIRRQPVAHGAFLQLEDRAILSLSPELFLEREGQRLRTRPMKGTAPRGRDGSEDAAIAAALAGDPKQRAENVMIADLMRNDLSRVCKPGSVSVHDVFAVERYRSLHQMVTGVEGELEDGVGLSEIIANLFPCGSITGAPKLSAMQIIKAEETGPRGIYTGSIGHVTPAGDFRFNVAIRTLVLRDTGLGEAGVGSGVVFDSGAAPEYDECLLKLKFLTAAEPPAFGLIETLGWSPDEGYLLLERHLDRLAGSAAYFGFTCDLAAVEAALQGVAAGFAGLTRVRLELASDGSHQITHAPMQAVAPGEVWDVCLADVRTDASDRFYYHKTTNREIYDGTRNRMVATKPGLREVLFENTDGFLTEGSFTTLFVAWNGRLLTPALRHGVLPGTLRAALLERRIAAEADLTRADLTTGDPVYVGNSVRGLIRVRLVDSV
ncbi:aminodeoxychorismate synthase component I [Microvirga tunisiensis]|uniref:Probable branched-chain-amino-acid aminotransferase n=1 Tax=Pannonibacter tanglangensis TaxID=2750084 RepID=A0A7X5J980_9HYPH|nr:aminodeoxychorismate synthase component I [Pannonibacter sp. XCT-53]